MLRLKKGRDKPVGHGNPSPRKLTRELSVRSASWTTVIVPSIYYWQNSPQTVILPLNPVGTDPKRSGSLIAQKLPFHPCPFSLKCGLLQPQPLCAEFLILWTLSAGTAGMCPYICLVVICFVFLVARNGACWASFVPNTSQYQTRELLSRLW